MLIFKRLVGVACKFLFMRFRVMTIYKGVSVIARADRQISSKAAPVRTSEWPEPNPAQSRTAEQSCIDAEPRLNDTR